MHNFFLECGARANKMRVYEMVDDPTAREMVGYLLVRGGVHIVAYARALEYLTGASMTKLVPVPDLSNKAFPETRKYEEQGLHRRLYTFSQEVLPTSGPGVQWRSPRRRPATGSSPRLTQRLPGPRPR